MTIRLLLNNHGETERLSHVANLAVESLVMPDGAQRVMGTSETFNRAVLHLDKEELQEFLAQPRGPFIALLVTKETGIELTRTHLVTKDHVVLAVRRMRAFNSASWQAFLAATYSEAVAVAEGRRTDLSVSACPMWSLVAVRSDWTQALHALCVLHNQSVKVAKKELKSNSWLKVLDKLPRGAPQAPSDAATLSAVTPQDAENMLLEELAAEGVTKDAAPEVIELAQDIAWLRPPSVGVVTAAAKRLRELM